MIWLQTFLNICCNCKWLKKAPTTITGVKVFIMKGKLSFKIVPQYHSKCTAASLSRKIRKSFFWNRSDLQTPLSDKKFWEKIAYFPPMGHVVA
jgi:hypothetical protein